MEARRCLMGVVAFAILMLVPATASHAVVITVFTDRTMWEAAVSNNFVEETFDDAILPPGVSFSSGCGATCNLGGGLFGAQIAGGEFHDRVSDGHAQDFTQWTFTTPIFAFGANWDLATPGGPGVGITVFFGPENVGQEISRFSNNGFFGFVSDTPFNFVQLSEGTQASGVETYDMDNMVYSPVPEPATLLLLGGGLLGTGILRRRRS